MNSKHLLLCLAAGLLLASCSAEPSDWRPDKKVSLDMVEPGTRSSQVFEQHSATAEEHHGATSEAHEPKMIIDGKEAPSAEKAMSANAEETERTKQETGEASLDAKPGSADTMPAQH